MAKAKKNVEESTVENQSQVADGKQDVQEILSKRVEIVPPIDADIDWYSLIPEKYIVINKSNFERRNKPVPTSLADVEDKDKLILLMGFRYIADLRGFSSLTYHPFCVQKDFVSIACEIEWTPLTPCDIPRTSQGLGDAKRENVGSFVGEYLTPIAENRSFVRCVRNFLRIPVLGQDEIGDSSTQTATQPTVAQEQAISPTSPHFVLNKILNEKDKTSTQLYKWYKKKHPDFEGVEWQNVTDIPNQIALELISLLKNQEKKEEK